MASAAEQLPRNSHDANRAHFQHSTPTTLLQSSTETEVAPFFVDLAKLSKGQTDHLRSIGLITSSTSTSSTNDTNEPKVKLLREKHIIYLISGLGSLSSGYTSLDASRPWIIYWCLHSLDILNSIPVHILPNIISTLSTFQSQSQTKTRGISGGFGGGPLQLSHGAPTYASCLSLLIIGATHPSAYVAINRSDLYKWFISLKVPHSGGFRMHEDGEVDVRGTYTVIAIASLLNLLTAELVEGVVEYTVGCQTYEGGFGGESGNEAHGGYAFCAIASLRILKALHRCDMEALRGWISRRQMSFEGGFSGRSNKLVDGCYSFWLGGGMAVLDFTENDDEDDSDDEDDVIELSSTNTTTNEPIETTPTLPANPGSGAGTMCYEQGTLQRYILLCGQHVDGGLRDKPSKMRDYYHSCYNLSGLSVTQHCSGTCASGAGEEKRRRVPVVYGDESNRVEKVNPLYNIRADRVKKARDFFKDMVCDHDSLMMDASEKEEKVKGEDGSRNIEVGG